MSKKLISILFLLIIFAVIALLIKSKAPKPNGTPEDKHPQIKVGNTSLYVDIAKTDQEKTKGLSGRKSLQDNEGMLFVFENKIQPSFWMIDMLIPLDIIWISDGKIVYINENVPTPVPETPNSQLPLYYPPTGINYVLEVNAGFSEKHGIEVGDSVDLSGIN